jgi:hypothetical protein
MRAGGNLSSTWLFLEQVCILSLESGARITTDCLITHFYMDALGNIPRSTQFDKEAMVLRVSERMNNQINFCESGTRLKG